MILENALKECHEVHEVLYLACTVHGLRYQCELFGMNSKNTIVSIAD